MVPGQDGTPINLLAGRGSVDGDWSGDGIANHWYAAYDPSVFTPQLTTESPAEGIRCQKISIHKSSGPTSTFNLATGITVGTSPLRPNSTLQVTLRWRTSATITNTQWKLWGNWTDGFGGGGDVAMSNQDWIQPSSTWQFLSGQMAVPAHATSIVIGVYLSAQPGACSGDLYFDDVQVTDGQVFPTRPTKALNTFLTYEPYANWLDTGNLFDGGALHVWQDREALEASYPKFFSCVWVSLAYVTNNYGEAPENLFEYDWILQNHPDWFLRDSNGNIISAKGQSSLDLGNVSYQQALLQKLTAMAQRETWKRLFFDYLDVHAADNTLDGRWPANYANDAQWQAACTQMLLALQPLRQMGLKLIFNVAHAPSYTQPGLAWFPLMDGWQIEWSYVTQDWNSSNILYSPWSSWLWKFRSQSENPTKYVLMGHRLPDQYKAARRFGMASFLCAMSPKSYFGYCASATENSYSTDFEAPLGVPLGNYVVSAGNMITGALVSRKFANGEVVVNPTDTQTFTYNVSGWCKDLDDFYVAPGTIVVPPKVGLILINTQPSPMSLGGTVTLSGYTAAQSSMPVTIDILDPGTQTIRQTVTVPGGAFLMPLTVPVGSYDIRFRAPNTFLTKRIPNVALAMGFTSLNITLPNGDVNGSGSVDVFDLNSIYMEIGTSGPYPTALGYTDLTGDLQTNIFDMNVVFGGMGQVGDN